MAAMISISATSFNPRAMRNTIPSIIKSKPLPFARLQGLSKAKCSGTPGAEEGGTKSKGVANELPEWSTLERLMLDGKPTAPGSLLIDSCGLGRVGRDGFVFRQLFSIRSYEIGADRKATLETLMNQLQEVGVNHFIAIGFLSDGFGLTQEMFKRKLIWVIIRMDIVVDRYPTWGDVVQVVTWISPSGKNKARREWLVLDCRTGETLARASSVWVAMNTHSRKLSTVPDEVRSEIAPYLVDKPPVVEGNGKKLSKLDDNTADEIQSGLAAGWNDLDVNEHVNNVKYITWILESVPKAIVKSHELSSMSIEYRRECGKDTILQSLTAISSAADEEFRHSSAGCVECQHLLRMEDGPEILRARTEWRSKLNKKPE